MNKKEIRAILNDLYEIAGTLDKSNYDKVYELIDEKIIKYKDMKIKSNDK